MRIKIPTTLYIDEAVADHPRVDALKRALPGINISYVKGENHPGNGWLITENHGKFIKPCPGQKGHICCGYWVAEWLLGCPFRCEYCALQAYLPSGDLILYTNMEKFYEEIVELRKRISGPIRLGTGEFGDSLALEPFFPTLEELVEVISPLENVTLELKTKSNWVEPLKEIDSRKDIIIAFSMNPDEMVQRYEHGAATLEERLRAIEIVLAWGYRIALHFDPIIYTAGWEKAYGEVVGALGSRVPRESLAWISMGSFRYPAGMDEAILKAHPETDLFRPEFVPGRDGKLRYVRVIREELYGSVLARLKRYFPEEAIYLCMESPDLWNRVFRKMASSKRLTEQLDAR